MRGAVAGALGMYVGHCFMVPARSACTAFGKTAANLWVRLQKLGAVLDIGCKLHLATCCRAQCHCASVYSWGLLGLRVGVGQWRRCGLRYAAIASGRSHNQWQQRAAQRQPQTSWCRRFGARCGLKEQRSRWCWESGRVRLCAACYHGGLWVKDVLQRGAAPSSAMRALLSASVLFCAPCGGGCAGCRPYDQSRPVFGAAMVVGSVPGEVRPGKRPGFVLGPQWGPDGVFVFM